MLYEMNFVLTWRIHLGTRLTHNMIYLPEQKYQLSLGAFTGKCSFLKKVITSTVTPVFVLIQSVQKAKVKHALNLIARSLAVCSTTQSGTIFKCLSFQLIFLKTYSSKQLFTKASDPNFRSWSTCLLHLKIF